MYRTTLHGPRWNFKDLRTVLAKATPPRSGDRLTGLAAPYCLAMVRSRAQDRQQYLANPDLGRRLRSEDCGRVLPSGRAIAIVIADGLPARATVHAALLLNLLIPRIYAAGLEAALFVASQARVAIGDEIGALAGADLVLVLIGERPGLSSPDSLGAYFTSSPQIGRNDAERNCVSNIRPESLAFADAAARLDWLIAAARVRGCTGVQLQDESSGAAAFAAHAQDRSTNPTGEFEP
jgi:ethanolamine ammonia-lyase small subunit